MTTSNYINQKGDQAPLAIVLMVIAYLVGFALNTTLARLFTPAIYGDYSIIMKLITFGVPFSIVGLNLATSRYIPKYLVMDREKKLAHFWHWLWQVFFISIFTLTFLGTLLLVSVYALHATKLVHILNWHPAIFIFWLLPIYSLILLLSGIFISVNEFAISYAPYNIFFNLSILIGVVLASLITDKLHLGHALLVEGLSGFLIICFQLYFLKEKFPLDKVHQKFKALPQQSRSWLKKSSNIMLYKSVNQGLATIDLVLLEIFGKHENEVAFLAAIFSISFFYWLVSGIYNSLLQPKIASNLALNDTAQLQQDINKLNKSKTIITLTVAVVILIFGKEILSLFGKQYEAYYFLLNVLSLSQIVGVLLGFSSLILTLSDNQNISLLLAIAQLLITTILGIFLIPHFGIRGVAWVFVSTLISARIISGAILWRKLKLTPYSLRALFISK